jgi:hypothetical protein
MDIPPFAKCAKDGAPFISYGTEELDLPNRALIRVHPRQESSFLLSAMHLDFLSLSVCQTSTIE